MYIALHSTITKISSINLLLHKIKKEFSFVAAYGNVPISVRQVSLIFFADLSLSFVYKTQIRWTQSHSFTGYAATEQYIHRQAGIVTTLCRTTSGSSNVSQYHSSGWQKSVRERIRKRTQYRQQSKRS